MQPPGGSTKQTHLHEAGVCSELPAGPQALTRCGVAAGVVSSALGRDAKELRGRYHSCRRELREGTPCLGPASQTHMIQPQPLTMPAAPGGSGVP